MRETRGKVCEKSARIAVKGTYTDIFGQAFQIDEMIDTEEFIEEITQLKQPVEPDVPRLPRDIKKELSEIRKAIYK